MARTFLRDAARLNQLHAELVALRDTIDNDQVVPERYHSTLAGYLSESDQQVITQAILVAHRLELWARFPSVHADSYVRTQPEAVA